MNTMLSERHELNKIALLELKKDVEEIHKGVVGEITQEHSLAVYRTEVNPTSILPFLNPDISGHMNFSKEYREIKEYLGKE